VRRRINSRAAQTDIRVWANASLKAWLDRIVAPGLTIDPAAGGLAGGRTVTVTAARGGGYAPGTPREGWDHRDPWLAHALSPIGIDEVRFIHAELTMSRERPLMSGLEDLEDQSIADAHAAIDAFFTPSAAPDLAA
jgi:FMN-dependent NADH-azoreductase